MRFGSSAGGGITASVVWCSEVVCATGSEHVELSWRGPGKVPEPVHQPKDVPGGVELFMQLRLSHGAAAAASRQPAKLEPANSPVNVFHPAGRTADDRRDKW